MRLYLRFALLTGIALALAGGAALWAGRAQATHRAQLAVWRDAAFMADRLGRDDLAHTALLGPVRGDQLIELDDLFDQDAVAPGIVRVTLFQPDGTVTYSSDHGLIGARSADPALLRQALAHGRAWAVGSAAGKRVLVAYVPVHWLFAAGGPPSGLLAVYRDYRPVAHEISQDVRTQALTTLGALLLLYAALFPILRRVTRALAERNRRLARQAAELRRLAAIVESSEDGIVGTTPDGAIASWNAGAERIYGLSAAEAVGKPVSLVAAGAEAAIRAGRSVVDEHAVHRRGDGAEIDVFLTISPVLDEDDRVVGASMIVRDVTDRLELERRLRRTQRAVAVGRLAGGVAHDFNNLLTGIGTYAELAARELPAGSAATWHVEEIRKATARGAALTAQLVDFEGRREIRPQVVDLNAVLGRTLPLLRRVIGEDVELSVDRAGEVLRVLADPVQLEQLIVTLVLNARDAGAADGGIELATAAADGAVVLTVADRGTDGARRHGLELAALWELVQETGGTVSVESVPGAGSIVRVTLPAALGPLAEPPAAPQPAPAARPEQATILLVEDEEIVRAVVREVLESAGHTVVAAHHGRQALELCEQHEGEIDVVLTDLVMPELGGVELAEQVRRQHPEIAVVLMSGYPDREVEVDGVPTRWLQKPFSHKELLAEVDAALAGRKLAVVR